jgi:hypothetical protein
MHLFARISVTIDAATSPVTPCEGILAIEFASNVSMGRLSLLNLPKFQSGNPSRAVPVTRIEVPSSGQPLLHRLPPL